MEFRSWSLGATCSLKYLVNSSSVAVSRLGIKCELYNLALKESQSSSTVACILSVLLSLLLGSNANNSA
ncbi:701_t:CDS:2 [Scutellospora calospora]|uniref:701_t:CDS:1 n=1 Tax=Scutellospora calospora TaxID=85575 RepID=A0ACA9JYP9_9GLOM|nr:701_t:CDS:2 [Scutellospora calospora]